MSCAMLILAGDADSSSGRLQALRLRGGVCLANHYARLALEAGGSPVLRVLGARALAVSARSGPPGVEDVFNLLWACGPGGYAACGLRAALTRDPALAGVLVLPCAPAGYDVATLRRAAEFIVDDAQALVEVSGVDGVDYPLGFGRAYFDEVLALSGEDIGLRILRRYQPRLRRVAARAEFTSAG